MPGTASYTVDRGEFDAAIARLRSRGVNEASREALLEIGDAFVTFIIRNGARDTNRFVRGYALAWNSIPGTRKKPVPALEVTSFADRIETALERDLAFASNVRRGAQRKLKKLEGYTDRRGQREFEKRVRKAERELDKAGDLEDRAITNLQRFREAQARNEPGFAIVFARRRGKKGSLTALSRVSRVFGADRTFGGKGRFVRVGADRWILTIENLEPHARIVNRATRIVSRAAARARTVGARRASDKALRELEASYAGRAA